MEDTDFKAIEYIVDKAEPLQITLETGYSYTFEFIDNADPDKIELLTVGVTSDETGLISVIELPTQFGNAVSGSTTTIQNNGSFAVRKGDELDIIPNHKEYGGYTLIDVQETDDAYYYSYGIFAGSGNFYQSNTGILCRIDKTTLQKQVLAQNAFGTEDDVEPKFYAFTEDDREYVLFNFGQGCKKLDTATGKIADTDMLLGAAGEAFYTISDETKTTQYWLYPDNSGTIRKVLPPLDFDTYDPYSYYVYIENIEYTGNFVFYEMVYYVDNPEPMSWRDFTIESHRETYLYDCSTGKQVMVSPMTPFASLIDG